VRVLCVLQPPVQQPVSTNLSLSAVAFTGGGIVAAGSSVVKVPIAVCIRSVQAGVYPNAVTAACSILVATSQCGLFTCTAINASSALQLSLQRLIQSSALAVCLQHRLFVCCTHYERTGRILLSAVPAVCRATCPSCWRT
jgi:hypothetical protein